MVPAFSSWNLSGDNSTTDWTVRFSRLFLRDNAFTAQERSCAADESYIFQSLFLYRAGVLLR